MAKKVAKEIQKVIKEVANEVPSFSKSDILKSDEFTKVEKDFLYAFLSEGKQYTLDKAKEILNRKLKGVIE